MPPAATARQAAARVPSPRPIASIGPAISAAIVCAALVGCHLIADRRGPGWASPLRIGDWLFSLALGIGVLALATALGRRVAAPLLGFDARLDGPTGRAEAVGAPSGGEPTLVDWLAGLGIGYSILSLLVLCAGFLRLYYGPLFLAAGAGLAVWLRTDLATLLRQLGGAATRTLAASSAARGPLQRAIGILLALTLLAACTRDMLPVTGDVPDWDGAAYHLSAPKIYVAAHALVPVPDIPLANAPSAADIFAVPGLLAGTDTLLKTLNLLFGLLLGLATYSLGARLFSRAAGVLGALLLLDLTWVIELLPATVPDIASAFMLVLGIGDALAWVDVTRAPVAAGVDGRSPRVAGWPVPGARLLLRAGLLLGGGISCKLTALPALPALVGAVGLLCLARTGVPPVQRLRDAVSAGFLLGVAALVPLGPWLFKSWYFFGNPLYPQAVATADTAASVACTGAGCTQSVAVPPDRLAWMLHSAAQVFTGYVSPLSAILLLAPFLLRGRAARAAMLFTAFGAVLWLAFVPLFLPPRYWLGLIAVAEVLIAASLLDLLGRLRLPARLSQVPLLAYLLLQGLYTLLVAMGLTQRSDVLSLMGGSTSPASYLAARVRPYAAMAYANAHLPGDARVALVHVTLGYYLDRPYRNDWYGSAAAARLAASRATRRAELAAWCTDGVRYAIVNRGSNEYNVDDVAGIRPLGTFAWVHEPGLRPRVLFSARGVDVLAVQPCVVTSALPSRR